MAQNIEQIRQQIKSVNASLKITKAMQLVATVKLKKLAKRVEKIKPYYFEVYNSFQQFLPYLKNSFFVIDNGEKKTETLWVVFNSNLGLCGSFNSNLNKIVLEQLQPEHKIITVGTKANIFFTKKNKIIIKSYDSFASNFCYEDTQDLTMTLISLFTNKEIKVIKIAYNKYVNTVSVVPIITDILPIKNIKQQKQKTPPKLADFEPNPETVIATAIPLYVGAMIYGAAIESQVSEQAARRVAMENAVNNAKEIKDNLLISYNRVRQSTITEEINEIIGGANHQKHKK